MRNDSRWLLAGLTLAASLYGPQALAVNECYWETGGPAPMSFIRDLGTLYVPRDATMGSIIGFTAPAAETDHPNRHEARCRFGDENGKTIEFHAAASVPIESQPLPPIEGDFSDGKILQTNIPGVGAFIKLGFPYTMSSNIGINNSFRHIGPPIVPYHGYRTPVWATLGWIQIFRVNNRVTLVKTGPIAPGPHQLNGGELFAGYVSDLGKVFGFGVTGTIIQAQCSVSGNPVSADPVQLGNWKASDFTAPGHTTQAVPFSITLSNCETDTSAGPVATAHIRLDGIKGSLPVGPTSNGVFSLTTDSTAQGVGIQLLRADGSTPMELGAEVPLMALTPGDHQLNFNARFYQIDPRVRPGLAKGSLNFTMTYK